MSEATIAEICKCIHEGKEGEERLKLLLLQKEIAQSLGRKEWFCSTDIQHGCIVTKREDADSLIISPESPMHLAAMLGNVNAIRALHEVANNSINAMANYSTGAVAPLHSAVMAGQTETVRLLLELGADHKVVGNSERGIIAGLHGTPLQFACDRFARREDGGEIEKMLRDLEGNVA